MNTQTLKTNHAEAIKLLNGIEEMEKRRQNSLKQIHQPNGTVFYDEDYLRRQAEIREKAILRLKARYHKMLFSNFNEVF